MFESRDSAVHLLYDQYKSSYGKALALSPLSDDADILSLWNKITKEHHISSDELAIRLASLANIQAHSADINVPSALANKIPTKTMIRFNIAVAAINDNTPIIATSNPFEPELSEALTFIFGNHYQLVVSPPSIINKAIDALKRGVGKRVNSTTSVRLDEHSEAKDKAIPTLAKMLLRKSVSQKASDMHLQPFLNGYVVRSRVDGILKQMALVPTDDAEGLIRHIKASAGMDTTNKMLPQDGRMLVELEGNEYDLRISTLPVAGGHEKLVIRFLSRQSIYALQDIGFSLDEMHTVNRLATRPSGVILVCGPTGSGKTTTLYSILHTLNDESISIMTVENPVEYQMQGLSQTEVNEKAGMTFARALRAILRQDPDVLLIGEIRDEETAQIAMQSALTGHLVLSTLHTNDSLSAIPRLLDLGINPIILAESLAGIMSQRLLRKLCHHCKGSTENPRPFSQAFEHVTHTPQPYEPIGCEECEFTGYKGRTVVAEIVEINQVQRELLLGGEKDISKFKNAMHGTFNSMSMSASRLVISGITTAQEAARVIGHQFWYALADEYNTTLPDLSALHGESTNQNNSKNAVLIAGKGNSSQRLEDALSKSWLTVFTANTPESANAMLHAHDNIELFILELDGDLTDEEVVAWVAHYRREVAWARIPALLRIPHGNEHWKSLLIEHGATSKFVTDDINTNEIVTLVQSAINENVDFRWGIER